MITLALVGKGRWGKNYINTINNLSTCELPDKFIKTSNYKDLFASRNINGVIIASPSSTHFKIAKEFLEKSFNVLLEKPMATSYDDALELSRIAKKYKNIFMVGHIYLYNPAFLKVKKLIKSIGRIKHISTEGMNNGPVRSDVSALWDWGPHDISMLIDLLGNLPQEVSAHGVSSLRPNTKFYDMCDLKLKFANDIYCSVNIGWLSPIKKRNMTIVGNRGTIVFDDTIENKIVIRNLETKEANYPPFPKDPPLTVEILNFVKQIQNKNNLNHSNLKMGLDVVKVLDACEKSIKLNGKIIKIN